MERRRRILGLRRENPTGGLREEVKLHPIKSLGDEEEAEQETKVRFSIFVVSLLLMEKMTAERGEEKRFGLSYSILQARDLSFLDPL